MTEATNVMNPTIKRVPYSKLLKREMADYAERTIGIVGEHNKEGSLIAPVFNKLLGQKPRIEILRLDFGIDTERLKIYNLKKDLKLRISNLKLNARLNSSKSNEQDLHVLNNTVDTHLRYLDKAKNDKVLTQRVAAFLDIAEKNEEISGVINDLNLTEFILGIKMALAAFTDSVKKRISLLAKRPSIKTQTINKGLSASIDNLLKAVEVSFLLSQAGDGEVDPDAPAGDTVDYETLMGELNELNLSYSRSINIRMHNNRRKAEQKKMEMEGAEGELGDEGNEGADGADGSFDDGIDNGIDDGAPAMQTTALYYDDAMDDELEGELSEELDHNLDHDADD